MEYFFDIQFNLNIIALGYEWEQEEECRERN